MEIKNISFIGSGNVATHLAKAFYGNGSQIVQVWSRTLENAVSLADAVQAEAVVSLESLEPVDLIIISVPDDALESIYEKLSDVPAVLAHTSGVSGLDFLMKQKESRVAYFYPLQTFRKQQELDMRATPFFVDARFSEDKVALEKLAKSISNQVMPIDSQQKKHLHLSAVVVNNFVNHLFGFVKENLTEQGLDFTALEPIIQTTIARAMKEQPFEIQTGPAKRNDSDTIDEHLELINNYPEFQTVYRCLTESIQRVQQEQKK